MGILPIQNISAVSSLNLPPSDWALCSVFAAENRKIEDGVYEAYIDFAWFEKDHTVKVNLGRVFADHEDDRALDYDVYLLLRKEGFTSAFAEIVIMARREGCNYLLIDSGLNPIPYLKTYREGAYSANSAYIVNQSWLKSLNLDGVEELFNLVEVAADGESAYMAITKEDTGKQIWSSFQQSFLKKYNILLEPIFHNSERDGSPKDEMKGLQFLALDVETLTEPALTLFYEDAIRHAYWVTKC